MILQLKTGRLDAGYFRDKFGVDILDEWRDVWQQYDDEGYFDSTATASRSRARACCASTACCRPSSSRSIRGCGTHERANREMSFVSPLRLC